MYSNWDTMDINAFIGMALNLKLAPIWCASRVQAVPKQVKQ